MQPPVSLVKKAEGNSLFYVLLYLTSDIRGRFDQDTEIGVMQPQPKNAGIRKKLERQGTGFPPKPPEEVHPCQHLDFDSLTLTSDFWLQNCERKICCFKTLHLW